MGKEALVSEKSWSILKRESQFINNALRVYTVLGTEEQQMVKNIPATPILRARLPCGEGEEAHLQTTTPEFCVTWLKQK